LIYPKEYGGWYSVSEERFWTEKDLKDGNCPISGNPVEWIEEKNYFFKMSNYQQALIDHIEANPTFITPTHRKNEVLGFLRQPLNDLCISRPKTRLNWGIELPFDTDYVTYVWFDALLNYLTGIGYPNDPQWQTWWANSTHVIGKDILTTHSVYWSTMLMALQLPLPKQIVAHGWWLSSDSKMSKTRGNVVNPMGMKDKYGLDIFRYYLLRDMVVGQDATFGEEALIQRNNTELANDLGNLVNRTLNLVEKRFGGLVPDYDVPDDAADADVREQTSSLAATATELIGEFKTHLAIEACMALIRRLNKYLNDTVPFKVVKENPARAGSIIRVVLDGLHQSATWLQPVMPQSMDDLLSRIGVVDGQLATGNAVNKGEPLFPKYELPAEPAAEDVSTPADEEPDSKPMITFEDFMKVELKVAQVISAEKVDGADKLLRLDVDLGTETRQVVAGIAAAYNPDELIGKRIVLVANLKPRKIFGLKSQGMILAARDGNNLFVVSPDGFAASGSEVS